MRLVRVTAAASALLAAISLAAPAFAGFGALACNKDCAKFGLSWDKPSQHEAEDSAMKDCGDNSCKIIFRTKSHECGAIAKAENGNGWGGAIRAARDAASLAAMQDCQKHTAGQCKLQHSECNR